MINPLLIYCIKKWKIGQRFTHLQNWICAKYNQNQVRVDIRNSNHGVGGRITVEIEYAAITSQMEIMIIFSLISPYTVVIAVCALYTNAFMYSKMIDNLKFIAICGNARYKSESDDYTYQINYLQHFPTFGLFWSILSSQLLIIGFCYSDFDYCIIVTFVAIIIIMDLLFFVLVANKRTQEWINSKTNSVFVPKQLHTHSDLNNEL